MPIFKAAPRAILQGIRDVSGTGIAFEQVPVPQHLPHILTLAERGPEYAWIASAATGGRIFGLDTFGLRTPYTTHQTPFLVDFLSRGNVTLLQRLIPTNAKKAMLRLSLEVIPAEVPLWERNANGTYQLDANGDRIQETESGNPASVIGHKLVLHTSVEAYTTGAKAFKAGTIVTPYRDGTVLGTNAAVLSALVDDNNDPVTSTLYPIIDLEVNFFGKYGDRIGAIITAPNALDVEPGDADKMNSVRAFLYDMYLVERPKDNITPIVTRTLNEELSIQAALKDDTYDPLLDDAALFLPQVLKEQYDASYDLSVTPVYSPFGQTHVYRDNIIAILTLLAEGGVVVNTSETTVGEGVYDNDANRLITDTAFTDRPDNYDLINFLTGVDQHGVPYWTFDVSSSVNYGGVAVGKNNVLYATGGDDGLTINASTGRPDILANSLTFDKLAKTQFENYGDLINFKDALRFPASRIYDTGFALNTKLALISVLGKRKDISISLTTHRFGEYAVPNTPVDNTWTLRGAQSVSEEQSIGTALIARLELFPESEVFGTRVARAVMFRQSGVIPQSKYPHRVPLSYHEATRVSFYMGRSDGRWRTESTAAPDDYPNNVVTTLVDINNTSKSEDSYIKDWDAGLCGAQSHDVGRAFIPAYQTVYFDDTSVLNSAITMFGCVELEKVCLRVWRELTGGSRLSPSEFLQKSDDKVVELTLDRFDGRFTIVPRTYFTAGDEKRGFSWNCEITLYAGNMYTVGVFTVTSDRLQNLGAQ